MSIRIAVLSLLLSTPLFSQTVENVLLILNEASPVSMDVGMYYVQKRGIPNANILRIKTTSEESISRDEFDRQIDSPIASWLARNSAQDRVLYFVLTKGVPLRITGSSGMDGTLASVDSELTLLYRQMVGQTILPAGPIKNPYFLSDSPLAQAKQFNHEHQDIFLVSRLDGYNLADIRGLIDRSFAPSKEGRILLDAKESLTEKGNSWLRDAVELLNNLAYALAVRKNSVQEALPLAEKAHGLAKGNSNISDTLGWIYHLNGQNDKAAKLLEDAAQSGTQNSEIHLHFAIVSAALGNQLAAEAALQHALKIDPNLEQSEAVRQLRANLKANHK